MSAKRCAREECGKSVYPIEELKCLDKVWHKQCFKCTVCGMTLNMKNYKGYDKMPYCAPHYPKTVASVVADTPEMRRIAENTKLQSQVQYHAEYEKMKGTKIEIADDPEMTRHLKNTQAQSQLAYTGEAARKAQQEGQRPLTVEGNSADAPPAMFSPTGPAHSGPAPSFDSPYSARQQQASTLVYSSETGPVSNGSSRVGSIHDYDPLNGQWGTVASQAAQHTAAGRTADRLMNMNLGGSTIRYCADFTEDTPPSAAKQVSPTQSVSSGRGSAASIDRRPSIEIRTAGFAVKAIYDYTAADKDEVTFLEGDVIVNCQKVDEGWMTGTVQRTLQWGMLPANYVETLKQPTGMHRLG